MRHRIDKLINVLAVIGCFCAGTWFVYWSLTQEATAMKAMSWPSAPGHITCSQAQKRAKGGYWLNIKYEYKVDGITFEGDRLSFGQNSPTRQKDVETLLGKYRIGTSVPVYYDPDAPAVSCLEPGRYEDATRIATLFGICLMMVGAVPLFIHLCLFLGRRQRKR